MARNLVVCRDGTVTWCHLGVSCAAIDEVRPRFKPTLWTSVTLDRHWS